MKKKSPLEMATVIGLFWTPSKWPFFMAEKHGVILPTTYVQPGMILQGPTPKNTQQGSWPS